MAQDNPKRRERATHRRNQFWASADLRARLTADVVGRARHIQDTRTQRVSVTTTTAFHASMLPVMAMTTEIR